MLERLDLEFVKGCLGWESVRECLLRQGGVPGLEELLHGG